MGGTAAYLVDDIDITVQLLDEPLEWRVRAVDELLIDAATSCRHRRSLHCGSIREFLPLEAQDKNTAFVALPVCSVPRGPLLDFDVEGPSGNAWLLPRLEIARREAAFLGLLAHRAGAEVSSRLVPLVEALVGFTDGSLADQDGRARDVATFVADGIAQALPATAHTNLMRADAACWTLLKPWSDKPWVSTALELPALGVPRLLTSGAAVDLDDAVETVREFAELIAAMSLAAQRGSEEASDFLNVLADYGHHFELTVATKVPVDEPFTLKFEERRSLKLSLWRNRGHQELLLADANTNHVTFRVDDPNVRIASCTAHAVDLSGRPAFGAFVPRNDEQTRSYYCYDDDRDYRARLEFRLTLLKRLMVTPYLIAILSAVLAVALIAADVRGARDVALVAGPVTVAAGVLSVRETTSLGSRLRLLNSTMVFVSLAMLVLAATWQLIPAR